MKISYLCIMLLAVSFTAPAQQHETVAASKQEKAHRENEVFIFPDNIKFSKNALNERVERKTKELTRIIKELAQKKGGDTRAEIDEALKLFNNNDRVMVTVTSKAHPEPVTKPIRVYLLGLAKLHYDKVNIVWHNAQYVSNFTKQPDGTYRGIVAVEQEFTGVKGGEVNYVYRDVTQKRAEVVVKVWDAKDETNVKKAYMDVFLGNIGVVEE